MCVCGGSTIRVLTLRGVEGALDFVVVVTPNPLHYDVSRTFLEACSRGLHHSLLLKLRGSKVLSLLLSQAGFPVLSDKPLTESFADAAKLLALVERTGLPFGLTHNYSGYPMARRLHSVVSVPPVLLQTK